MNPQAVEELSRTISAWLFDPDIRPLVRNWLTEKDLQLVFSVDQALQAQLGEVPIELLQADAPHHLVVDSHVKSIVHLLPKVGVPPDATIGLDWPFRVLIVRSNPSDISNGRVPAAEPFRQKILAIAANRFGPGHVDVDLLSSEAGAATIGLPTFQRFRESLDISDYDVLVFLGHGDIEQVHPDMPPISLLHFERDGRLHDPINSRQLAAVLHRRRVPVVVLAGCLTAAAPGDPELDGLPIWMRGNQGMAQALVNSESGVAFAVGMRCRVEAEDALTFVDKFFTSLLQTNRGDVERAVYEGRYELSVLKPFTASWAAPMAFTSLRPEPLLPYMIKDPIFRQSENMKMDLKTRATVIWPLLAEQKLAMRSPALAAVAKANRDSLAAGVLQTGAMLLPELVDGAQPGTTATVSVTFDGALTLKQFQGKFIVGPGLKVAAVRGARPLLDAGFRVWSNSTDPGSFLILSSAGATALPKGSILELDVGIQPEARGVCLVDLEAVATDAVQPFWAGHNAVIVLPA
jgi:hypothetical protein